jgi:hypothetical protein
MSPSDKVALLYIEASGSLFVAFYDPQGYNRGIRTRVHAGLINEYKNEIYQTDHY